MTTPYVEFHDGQYFTLANQGEQFVTKEEDLERHIRYAIEAYGRHAKSGRAVRKFDRRTPSVTHPLDCFTEILNEPLLSEGDRAAGSLALLYHDVIEDSTLPLPDGLSPRVVQLVADMTYPGGTPDEMVNVWDKEPFVLLCKLYDKASNRKTMSWMDPSKKTAYDAHIRRLCDEAAAVYDSDLNIFRIARALIR